MGPVQGTPSEAGAQASFTVALSGPPSASVSVALTSDDPGEGQVSPAQLTFTPENWNAPQRVLVTGVDDDLADGPQDFSISFEPAQSDDSRYAGVTAPPVRMTNVDDDTAGFALTEASRATNEEGAQASFTVALHSQPLANVTLRFDSSDPGEGIVEHRELTFTPVNWRAPQTVTVTGMDDDEADGDQPYAIVFQRAQSEDPGYAPLTPSSVAFLNTDNDTAGFTLTPLSGDTTEAGGEASLTLVLNSQPSADVTVRVHSSDPGEGKVSTGTLTFTPANWKAPQTVRVTGVDDEGADGDQPYSLVFSTTSGDLAYAALKLPSVPLANLDDDSVGIRVSAASGPTSEAGGQASFTVALASKPLSPVTLPFQSSDETEGTLAVTRLTFTPVNWKAPQTVRVTGVDDELVDGDQPYAITFGATTSDDPAYAALTPAAVAMSNLDDDSAGILVGAPTGPTSEAGGQASFSVVLTAAPSSPVTLPFHSSDVTEGTLAITSLTFTPVNWNAPQAVLVSGVNDEVADGDQPYTIIFGATTSADPAYATLTPAAVAMSNLDDDSAGILVSAPTGPTSEAGGQVSFSVVLSSEPRASVTVRFQSSDSTEGTLSRTSLTFTPTNWKAPQTVLVTGVNDDLEDGNQPYAITFGTTTSADPTYAAITPAALSLTNVDDDTAGFVVVASGSTTESGGQATLTLSLTSEPYAPVVLLLASSDTTEATLSASRLTFTSTNWKAPQVVRVTGIDDDVADGDQPVTVLFTEVQSTDAAYVAAKPANVGFVNLDNDSAGILVSAVSGATTEAGGTASFTVVLSSQPLADVTLPLSSTNPSEGVLSTGSLVFTPVNWKAPQRVEVTGLDDELADGDQPYAIVFSASTSADPTYAGRTPANVPLVNGDDDTAGVVVSAASGPTSEAGGSATFTVVLTSRPFASVTYVFDSTDLSEGTVEPRSLTFTPSTWNVPRTVTVTGVNDSIADGDQPYAVAFEPPISDDATYAALVPASVALLNQDDGDSGGISLTPKSGTTTEAGGGVTFSAVLLSAPTASVTLHFQSNDLSEGTLDKTSVTFTPGDWNVPRTFTVTGVSDLLVDGDQPYAIVFSETTSADPTYDTLIPPPLTLVNLDTPGAATSRTWTFDSGLEGWSVTGTSATVGWNADNTPTSVPGGAVHAGARSLNYNNGVNYDDGADHSGTATSPFVHMGSGARPQLTFWCNHQTEETGTSYDQRFVRIHRRSNAGTVLAVEAQLSALASPAGACAAMGAWHLHTLDLDPAWGTVQVSFTFMTVDGQYNNYAGWFIDDVTLRFAP
ncbi:Calx-beta domain-containing protein [Melittangium boletus]|uniref:Calx-beta domain-containing protein n=1 Tax=Melittangium boletus DSM 14713 TaxID=1294270 RepID=A0A250IPA4_9BACT|nr:Calx-beta domain-containing protein [Melittangium boletus]ATB32766.1 hypothetical protein MEBOL_006255 [Melittangium boletus DSM 14713]